MSSQRFRGLATVAGLVLRVVSVSLSVLLFFWVEFSFGTEAAGYYQTFVAYTLFLAGTGTLGFQYVGIAEASQSVTRSNITFTYAAISGLILTGLGWILYFGVQGATAVLVCWGGLACLQVIAAHAKANDETLTSIFFENATPYLLLAGAILITLAIVGADDEGGAIRFIAVFSSVSIVVFNISHIASIIYLRTRIGASFGHGLRRAGHIVKAFRARAKHNLVSILSSLLFNKVELFIFGAAAMYAEAGLFAKALIIGNIASMPHNFGSSIFLPRFIRDLKQGSLDSARAYLVACRVSVSIVTASTVALIVGAVFAYSVLIAPLDGRFVACVLIVCAGNLVTSFSGFFHYGLIALGHERECSRVNFIAAAGNVLAALVLVFNFHEIGACVSVFLGHLIKSGLGYSAMRKSRLYAPDQ